jgi:aminoglycoside 6'-N-acetyltransferase
MTPGATDDRYAFAPLRPDDLPLIARWLRAEHMVEWWGDPQEALAEIEAALADPATDPYLVSVDGRPLGYVQAYRPHDEPGHPYADQPPGTVGIDQSIGEPGDLGRGHGTAFIRRFVADRFREGWRRVVTDPDPANGRAIRAYEKAGFRRIEERDTPFGRVLLMACDAPPRTA